MQHNATHYHTATKNAQLTGGQSKHCNKLHCTCIAVWSRRSVLQRVAVCCSVLQCVAVCCSVLQCVAKSRGETTDSDEITSLVVSQCVASCCNLRECWVLHDNARHCNTHCRTMQDTVTHLLSLEGNDSPAPMNHEKTFMGWPPRDAPSKLVQLWYKTFPPDQLGQVEMKKPTRLSNTPSTVCMIFCGGSDSGA